MHIFHIKNGMFRSGFPVIDFSHGSLSAGKWDQGSPSRRAFSLILPQQEKKADAQQKDTAPPHSGRLHHQRVLSLFLFYFFSLTLPTDPDCAHRTDPVFCFPAAPLGLPVDGDLHPLDRSYPVKESINGIQRHIPP